MIKHSGKSEFAIISYSYRMPGGIESDADFWDVLEQRKVVREPVLDRYGRGVRPICGESDTIRLASPFEGLIRDEKEWEFDQGFFGINRDELVTLNPNARMLTNCSWEAIEKAGLDLRTLRNSSTGVFIGTQLPSAANKRPMYGVSAYSTTSLSLAILANRISFQYNLMGPSMACCTACSAALTALHTALNSIRSGDCEQVLVGSVNYLDGARTSASFNALGVTSPTGFCHSFDAAADGYMRSEGAFAFIIKPLSAAERDGDKIFAVIESTFLNTAGAADGTDGLNQGRMITAPTRHSQAAVMREACVRAHREPEEFDYIEAHATGTIVGDRIEGSAIADVFGDIDRERALQVASVKSNVGHMEAAAFHCSLIKVLLMMERRTFAPISRNFLVLNPELQFAEKKMEVPVSSTPFPDHPVIMGINSFGFGGANGHCVIREYQPEERPVWSIPLSRKTSYLFPISARLVNALQPTIRELGEFLEQHPVDLYTLAGNLSVRRTHFPARAAFVADDQESLVQQLKAFSDEDKSISSTAEGQRRIALIFSGQGTQWAGCGKELYDSDPVFRRAIDAIESYWLRHSHISLRDACFHASQDELDECRLAQPVIFMIQCALVELYKTWGVYADGVLGHSSGEVAAAYASGALTLEQATRLVYHRSTLQQRTAGSGRMLAVGLDRAGIEALLDEHGLLAIAEDGAAEAPTVEIACVNSPVSTVVCGKLEALQPVMRALDERKAQHELIPGNIAFHSHAMETIREDVGKDLAFLDGLPFSLNTPFYSSVTGTRQTRLDSKYWWTNMRKPVQFASAMTALCNELKPDLIIEVAPHSALHPLILQCVGGEVSSTSVIPTMKRNENSRVSFRKALGVLFCQGVDLDFASQFPRPEPITHWLPGHWRSPSKVKDDESNDDERFGKRAPNSHGPLVGSRIDHSSLLFENSFGKKEYPWMADHWVHGAPIMPAAGYVELILEALEGAPVHFERVDFVQPCLVDTPPRRLHTQLDPDPDRPGQFAFSITSQSYEDPNSSLLHCQGRVGRIDEAFHSDVPNLTLPETLQAFFKEGSIIDIYNAAKDDLASLMREFSTKASLVEKPQSFYTYLENIIGQWFRYGKYFQVAQNIRVNTVDNSILCDVVIDEDLWHNGNAEGYVMPPPLMDGGLQMFLYYAMLSPEQATIPRQMLGLTFLKPPVTNRVTCHIVVPSSPLSFNDCGQYDPKLGKGTSVSISFYDTETGDLIAHLPDYNSFQTNPKWNDALHSKHRIVWQPKSLPDIGRHVASLSGSTPSAITIMDMIGALTEDMPRFSHVIEFTVGTVPEQTHLHQCIKVLSDRHDSLEYWLVGADKDSAISLYNAFNTQKIPVRFESLENGKMPDLASGLLRESSADLLLLHAPFDMFTEEPWIFLHNLAVENGLLLITHAAKEHIGLTDGWKVIRAWPKATLLQRSELASTQKKRSGPGSLRWVMGEDQDFVKAWLSMLESDEVSAHCPATFENEGFLEIEGWTNAERVEAIDLFFGEDSRDPTGEKAVVRLIGFMHALISLQRVSSYPIRLTVITRGAVFDVDTPRCGALWGAIRSLAREISEDQGIEFNLVDIKTTDDLISLRQIQQKAFREREFVIRNNRIWVPRIAHMEERYPAVPAGESPSYRLVVDNPGQLSGLQMKAYDPPELGPDDVEIVVDSAALNFRDVMLALGLLPELSFEHSSFGNEIGMEGSGRVSRAGSSIRNFHEGDEVVFTTGGCIANRLVLNQKQVLGKPDRLDMSEAASSLSVYATAYYALIHLAQMKKGQRLLVHSAMGGVGQAAIALAKYIGVEIYATAGNDEKRERLKELGVCAVFDSHSHGWYEDVMRETNGEGVDIVLNSLAGRHVSLCLEALRPGGHHCEIGKIDIYSDNPLNLQVFRKNLRFYAIDMDRLMMDDPQLSRHISETCIAMLGSGALPALPVTCFRYADYEEAFRLMTTGQHQGKLVLKAPDTTDFHLAVADRRKFLDPDATYLITGGFGGLGPKVLAYLVMSGARHFTFMDRDPQHRRDSKWLRVKSLMNYLPDIDPDDIDIDIVYGTVEDEAHVKRCIDQLNRPLKGVFHLAGVLDDRLLNDMSPDSVKTVFAPKARGALNLHNATLSLNLDHFVLFSSIASTFGNPGQINYGAANAFMDALASFRQKQKLPALAYNISGVSEVGMASENKHVVRMMQAAGLPPISSRLTIANLDYAMRSMGNCDHIVSSTFKRPPWPVDMLDYMKLGHLVSNQDAFGVAIDSELTHDDITAQIRDKVLELCGNEGVSIDEPLANFGMNSITVSELGAFIQNQFNYRVNALELMTTASCSSLAHAILDDTPDESDVEKEEKTLDTVIDDMDYEKHDQRMPSVFSVALEEHFPPANLSSQHDAG